MTWIVMIIVLLIGAVLQSIMPGYVVLGQAKHPILVGIVLYYALSRDMNVAMVAAFGAGFLQDALTPMVPLGYSIFFFCLVVLVVGRFRNLVLVESVATSAFFGAVAGMLVNIGFGFLLATDLDTKCSLDRVLLRTLGTALLGAVTTPIVFFMIVRLDQLVGNIEIKESIDNVE
ncbi:MAG: rod shape-determining protein MreD [Lentisphaerae bacterium]|nr:rod shape-determining protein MreD [Lentisphaerota bacterium]